MVIRSSVSIFVFQFEHIHIVQEALENGAEGTRAQQLRRLGLLDSCRRKLPLRSILPVYE
jgi:hypothetical protein